MSEKNNESVEIVQNRAIKLCKYRGYEIDELLKMSIIEFAKICSAKSRRKLMRGITVEEEKLIKDVLHYQKVHLQKNERPASIKTLERSMVVLPCMLNTVIAIHRGNGYFEVEIKPDMLGYKLRDFVTTRVHPKHGRKTVGIISTSKVSVVK